MARLRGAAPTSFFQLALLWILPVSFFTLQTPITTQSASSAFQTVAFRGLLARATQALPTVSAPLPGSSSPPHSL